MNLQVCPKTPRAWFPGNELDLEKTRRAFIDFVRNRKVKIRGIGCAV
jgi:hypothetical protein